jgi:nitroreductase
LLQLLQQRHTSREFTTRPIEAQTLSNLLWAAYGVNRPDGKRTAPSGHDWQYIDVYIADSSGLYRYEAKEHQLVLCRPGDIRSKTGLQGFATTAPVSLIYVNDARKFPQGSPDEEKLLFGATTAGAIVQNVYLYCAANNLNTGVRADIDRPVLHAAMGLAPEQRILLAQSVGAPPGAK